MAYLRLWRHRHTGKCPNVLYLIATSYLQLIMENSNISSSAVAETKCGVYFLLF